MSDDPRTATTLAYVGASKRVSSRLSNLFHHIYPDMLGVWLMGSDRSDRERVLYGRGDVIVTGAGVFPAFKIDAETDIELVAAFAARDNAAGDELDVTVKSGDAAGATAGWTEILGPDQPLGFGLQTANGSAGARVYRGELGVAFAGVPLHALAHTIVQCPGLPTVLGAGRSFEMYSETAVTTLRGGFIWRVLG
jgi:hypothetical protein